MLGIDVSPADSWVARNVVLPVGISFYTFELVVLVDAAPGEKQAVKGIGPVIARSIGDFFANPRNREELARLKAAGARWPPEAQAKRREGGPLEGKTFALTGTLPGMTLDEAKRRIEEAGGAR